MSHLKDRDLIQVRRPLKRLREHPPHSDNLSGHDGESPQGSPKKQPCKSLEEETENLYPEPSFVSKKFRSQEQGIKPDTPVVASVKSRLQRLAEQRKDWDSDELLPDIALSNAQASLVKNEQSGALTSRSWRDGLARAPIRNFRDKMTETAQIVAGCEVSRELEGVMSAGSMMKTIPPAVALTAANAVQSVRGKFEEMNREREAYEESAICPKIVAVTTNTKAIQDQLLRQSTPSASHALRIKKEREKELSMIRGKTEEKNLWMEKKKSTKSCKSIELKDAIVGVDQPLVKGLVHQEELGQADMYPDTIVAGDICDSSEQSEKHEDPLTITSDADDFKGEEPLTWSTPVRKVTFALEPSTIPSLEYVETESEHEYITETDIESSSQETLNNSEIIDKLFEGVFNAVEGEEEEEVQEKELVKVEEAKVEEEEAMKVDEGEPEDQEGAELVSLEAKAVEQSEDEKVELKSEAKHPEEADGLSLPHTSLSPLVTSVNLDSATPLGEVLSSLNKLTDSTCSLFASLKSDAPEEEKKAAASSPPTVLESEPFYSIDVYRTQRRNSKQWASVKPGERNQCNRDPVGRAHQAAQQVATKDKVKMFNDEINKLHNIMHQASQALNCCIDQEHGKGSQEEAEAERHLLIASEKRASLLAELNRLKGESSSLCGDGTSQPREGLVPCQGTVSISDLRLPLKADFVCSALSKQEKPSHYFLLMIRYGPHNIVASPLATAENAQNGDTIPFPTSITLYDIHHAFEIDVEVYSLTHTANITIPEKRRGSRSSSRSRSKALTPKKLLTSITRSSVHSPAISPAVRNSVRASNFVLVGSHKITLASLGKKKFPLDKMKFDGKVRQLLGDEFQDKVPFLSPLEGNIYLKLECQMHSTVEHSGFLTMFEDVSGFGAWHRRWFVLSGNKLSYWMYPDEEKFKMPVGLINLTNCTNDQIEPASREFCSRSKTLELITARPQCKDDHETLIVQCRNNLCFTKNWLSADTKEERNLWMEKFNQSLIDLKTWQPTSCDTANLYLGTEAVKESKC
ncbi:anillin isoform X1 [Callorhinchus milii]|uniref:anillin isoform X1 n=1 Tax=Callorhinchus milii TaxID=7868 RepID=UPI001C3F852D|nr:anillin isoform X1 [Callorhinchus milii]XP_042196473.1 anillin isoform X1 [Callorhinchus milii]